MKTESGYKTLSVISLMVLLAGAAGSIVFTLNAGRHNSSVLLPLLFTGWVVSPYMALLVIRFYSRLRLAISDATYLSITLFITLVSLSAYSGVFSLPGMKHAFVFLAVPAFSWFIIIISLLLRRRKLNN